MLTTCKAFVQLFVKCCTDRDHGIRVVSQAPKIKDFGHEPANLIAVTASLDRAACNSQHELPHVGSQALYSPISLSIAHSVNFARRPLGFEG